MTPAQQTTVGLLLAALADPLDPVTRNILADWYADNGGEETAAFLRRNTAYFEVLNGWLCCVDPTTPQGGLRLVELSPALRMERIA